jgi:hypothetical protein
MIVSRGATSARSGLATNGRNLDEQPLPLGSRLSFRPVPSNSGFMAWVTCSGARLMRAHFRLARVRLLKMAGPREGERDV